MIVTSTQRIALRRFCDTDAESMIAVLGDAEVMRFGDGPQSREWIQGWIEQTIKHYDLWGFGVWAIVTREPDAPIGYCGLSRFEDINGRSEVELGYRLAKEHWGNGLATEAATAVRDLAFDELGLERLVSLIDPDNLRSIRVAEKLGMIHTDDVMLPGYSHPDRVYSCTKAAR